MVSSKGVLRWHGRGGQEPELPTAPPSSATRVGDCRTRKEAVYKKGKKDAPSDEGMALLGKVPSSVRPTSSQLSPVLPIEEACHRLDRIWHVVVVVSSYAAEAACECPLSPVTTWKKVMQVVTCRRHHVRARSRLKTGKGTKREEERERKGGKGGDETLNWRKKLCNSNIRGVCGCVCEFENR